MKNHVKIKMLLAALVVLIMNPVLFGQNVWKLNGNSISTSKYLGTKNNRSLKIKTNNVERMRISNLGNVGIGTTNPLHALEVHGKGNGLVFLSTATSGTDRNPGLELRGVANNAICYIDFTNGSTSTSGWGSPDFRGRISFNETGTGGFSIRGSGVKLGVATNTPTQTLDVNGTARIRQLPTTTTISDVVVADANGVLYRNTDFTGGGGDADWHETPGTAPDDINDDIYTHGMVGIGIDNPSVALHVKGTAPVLRLDAGNNYLELQGNSSTAWIRTSGTGIGILFSQTSNFMELRQSVIRNIAIPGQTGYEITANPSQVANIFEVRDSGGLPGNLFVIDSDGDVGIGTPTPAEVLHVEGSFLDVLGSFTLENNTDLGGLGLTGSGASYNDAFESHLAGTFDLSGFGLGNSSALSSEDLITGDRFFVVTNTTNASINFRDGATGDNHAFGVEPTRVGFRFDDGPTLKEFQIDATGFSFINTGIGPLVTVSNSGDVGIGTTTPGKKLEITSSDPDESGLRFTNLTYNTPTSGTSGNCDKVLTVDNDGDVILVDLTDCSTSPKTADIENIERELNATKEELQLLNEKFSRLEQQMEQNQIIQSNTIIPATQNDAINVRLGSVPVLYQNTPNPFGVNTEISLFLPKSAVNAIIVFHDDFGKVLKEVVVEERGMNKINLDGRDLSSGIYTYSLMIDGDIIDTKKMMKAE